MSGSAPVLPAAIGIQQTVVGPTVTITQGTPAPAGLPPYPLSADPSQVWDLELVGGVPTWVPFTAPPGQTAIGLEDGVGAFLLEDGAGYMLMEP